MVEIITILSSRGDGMSNYASIVQQLGAGQTTKISKDWMDRTDRHKKKLPRSMREGWNQ